MSESSASSGPATLTATGSGSAVAGSAALSSRSLSTRTAGVGSSTTICSGSSSAAAAGSTSTPSSTGGTKSSAALPSSPSASTSGSTETRRRFFELDSVGEGLRLDSRLDSRWCGRWSELSAREGVVSEATASSQGEKEDALRVVVPVAPTAVPSVPSSCSALAFLESGPHRGAPRSKDRQGDRVVVSRVATVHRAPLLGDSFPRRDCCGGTPRGGRRRVEFGLWTGRDRVGWVGKEGRRDERGVG